MWLVGLVHGHGVKINFFIHVGYAEIEYVFIFYIAQWQQDTVLVHILVDKYTVGAVSTVRPNGQSILKGIYDTAHLEVCKHRVVHRTVQRGAGAHHRHDQEEDWNYFSHLIFFSI
jgi:hypothetical protein